MILRFCFCVFLFFIVDGPAFAGPPLLTDDPDTPGDKHWEINIAFILEKTTTEAVIQAPLLDLNYGVGDNIQLKYEVPLQIQNEQGIGTQIGLGNSLVGVKWRFIDEEKFGVNISTYPQLEFNSTTSLTVSGLVDKGTNLLLPVEVSKKFGPFRVVGELGYTIRQYSDNDWFYGLCSGYELLENLTLMGEIHGGVTKEFKREETVFNIGTQWDFSKRFGLLASAGRSVSRAASDEPNLLLYLGLQLRL
jgi:hypothetical protein